MLGLFNRLPQALWREGRRQVRDPEWGEGVKDYRAFSKELLGHIRDRGISFEVFADEFPEMGFRSPKSLGGSPVSILLYFPDVDAVFQRAIAGGAKQLRPVADQFYGDRNGTLEDPFGHVWTIATHTEDLSPEEMKKREAAAGK